MLVCFFGRFVLSLKVVAALVVWLLCLSLVYCSAGVCTVVILFICVEVLGFIVMFVCLCFVMLWVSVA